MAQGSDGADGLAECGRYFRKGEPSDHLQHKHFALLGWELLEGGYELRASRSPFATASRSSGADVHPCSRANATASSLE